MFVSRDNPFYFLTFVTHERLPVFQTEKLKEVVAKALDEARASSGIKIFVYAIMPDHIHLITDSRMKTSEVLRYVKGISARRMIDHLKKNGFETSLAKLRQMEAKRGYKYTLWQNHSN